MLIYINTMHRSSFSLTVLTPRQIKK